MSVATLTADHYRRNAFRVTGLPVTASARTIRRRRRELELGVVPDVARGALPLEEPPTPTDLQAAFARLDDPRMRIVDELTWLWDAAGETGVDAASRTRHDRAVTHHCRALDLEARAGSLSEPERRERDEAWTLAMQGWAQVADDPDVWSHLRDRAAEIADARLPVSRVTTMRNRLVDDLLSLGAELAVAQGRAGAQDIGRYRRYLLELTGGSPGPVDAALRSALLGLVGEIDTASETVSNVAQARALPDTVERPLGIIARLLPDSDTARRRLGDTVAVAIRSQAVDHANSLINQDPRRSSESPTAIVSRLRLAMDTARELLEIAEDYAEATSLQESIVKDLDTLNELEETIGEIENRASVGMRYGTRSRGAFPQYQPPRPRPAIGGFVLFGVGAAVFTWFGIPAVALVFLVLFLISGLSSARLALHRAAWTTVVLALSIGLLVVLILGFAGVLTP